MRRNMKTLGNMILLFTAMIWGMSFSFQSQAAAVLDPFTIGGIRSVLSAVEVGILCMIMDLKAGKNRENTDPLYKRYTIMGGIVCGVFMFLGSTLQQIGLAYTSAGKAGFITALYIVFVPVISAVFLHRKISARIWIAVGIALVGMYLLTISGVETICVGDLWVLGCAVFFALQILMIDRFAPMVNPIKLAEIQFIVTGVGSWICAFLFGNPNIPAIRAAMGPMLYVGCISGGVGYTLQMIGQRYADPTPASLCMSFESVFSVVGGVLILHQMLKPRELIGCVIMFLAIVLIQLPEKKRAGSVKSSEPDL